VGIWIFVAKKFEALSFLFSWIRCY